MATELRGPITCSGEKDENGDRLYKITHLVASDGLVSPTAVMLTPGLPQVGDSWNFFGDSDPWAFCKQTASVRRHQDREGDPHLYWAIEQTFSSKSDAKRCKDQQVDDPLLEPMKISGSFGVFTEEATYDRFGQAIRSSSWEMLRGPQVEFDVAKASVVIEQNVSDLQLPLLAAMNNTVNNAQLWGLPRRAAKLTVPSWDAKYFGACQRYYTRKLQFDIMLKLNPQTGAVLGGGFDRDILDEGLKVLHGHWGSTGSWVVDEINGSAADRGNPNHFDQFKDRRGENCRVVLDGFGQPAGVVVTTTDYVCIRRGAHANIGEPLTNLAIWQPLSVINGRARIWDNLVTYPAGSLVYDTPGGGVVLVAGLPKKEIFVSKVASLGVQPSTDFGAATWVDLEGDDLANRGVWEATSGYTIADWVTSPVSISNAGFRHVEKYAEGNFLLLGIPVLL